ncbi:MULTISPECIES: ATP-binding protein [Bacillus]|uniref:ATP-binding protein n=1 Tax=Bacillus TaxID=1386 RepID=UPI002112BB3B|nr:MULTISPECIES: sensor histidine kinase [Bacillus]MED1747543.1 sensor histidine kinase [Bacillus zhangzhouensis]UUD42117.1 sensor histidine kinase [Bacillus pumilus]
MNLLKKWLNTEPYLIVMLIVLTPIGGELKFYPFEDSFRVSFGTVVFFFILLQMKRFPAWASGIIAGVSVFAFRVLLDTAVTGHLPLEEAVSLRLPPLLYYVVYGTLFYLLQVRRFRDKPWLIGATGIIMELCASVVEMVALRGTIDEILTVRTLFQLFVLAIFRSFFVLACYTMIRLYEEQARERQMKKEKEHLLMLLSNLYTESTYFHKTLAHAEHITATSYQLYQSLHHAKDAESLDLKKLGKTALQIAGEVHEIKKDNQRIFSALSKLIHEEKFQEYESPAHIAGLVIRIHENYAESLKKNIVFHYDEEGQHPVYHVYTILSLLNNIVSNAVEAIPVDGEVSLSISREEKDVLFQISDNGPGIKERNHHVIFKPGFTLKYDQAGNPSSGIGLSYVKDTAEKLGGSVEMKSIPNKQTIFTLKLPVDQVSRKEGIGR